MRVAFVSETWLPSTDGVVTRLVATCRELVRTGHEVLMVAPRPTPGLEPAEPVAGVDVREVPTVGFKFIAGGQRWGLPVPAVARHLRDFRPDVVHVVNPAFLGVAGVVAARLRRRPLVESFHTDVATYAGFYHLGLLRPGIWKLLRALHNRADVNLATSEASRRLLGEHGVGRVRLWPRGVDLNLFHPSTAGDDDRARPVALYVGRLAPEKGVLRLAALADPASGFDLVVVGDGPDRNRVRRRLSAANVRFTGLLHGTELADAYRSADVFVFPSTTDTLGLVVLEALASGLPVVAAESPPSTELLGGCAAARLVPPEPQAMVAAAANLVAARAAAPTGAERSLGMVARAVAADWSWGAATEALLDCYREAIETARPTSGGHG